VNRWRQRYRSKVQYRSALIARIVGIIVDDVVSFLRGVAQAVCGPCISSTRSHRRVTSDPVALETDGILVLEVATCQQCGQREPSYRRA
jgi:hypothetical protein